MQQATFVTLYGKNNNKIYIRMTTMVKYQHTLDLHLTFSRVGKIN